ncbi:MAG TPA: hypothetical protein VNU21_10795 [Usitatibacter sp.]|jgi:hypothetical protein|nr:hypothetical protein [Usitatibacter sp.]
MSSESRHTDFQSIEDLIIQARLERTVTLAHLFADGVEALGRGVNRVVHSVIGGFANAANARTVEADAFMRRSMSRH